MNGVYRTIAGRIRVDLQELAGVGRAHRPHLAARAGRYR